MLFLTWWTMTHICPIYSQRILNHARRLECCACYVLSHMKCITLAPDGQQSLYLYQNEWLCKSCLSTIFPFNNILIDKEFIAAVNCIDKTATQNDSDIIFHPFEINDTDHISPLCEIDPDLHFYNSIDFHLSKCNNYEEISFAQIAPNMANLSQSLSLCHLNIRSIKKIYLILLHTWIALVSDFLLLVLRKFGWKMIYAILMVLRVMNYLKNIVPPKPGAVLCYSLHKK